VYTFDNLTINNQGVYSGWVFGKWSLKDKPVLHMGSTNYFPKLPLNALPSCKTGFFMQDDQSITQYLKELFAELWKLLVTEPL
jgi:hypothetical protein